MKFLEGKSPAERNKTIAAIVLGGVAVIALGYTLSGFVVSGSKDPKLKPTPTPTATPVKVSDNNGGMTVSPDELALLTQPVIYYPQSFSSDAGRNVFAFYEPPPPTPYSPTPVYVKPIPPPTPTPTPPIMVTYMSPSTIYAGSKTFRMELAGERFSSDAVILFNGSELPTNFINPQKITADVPAVLISSDGGKSVLVRTPDGKAYSNQIYLQVQPPPVPNFEYIGLVEKKHRNNDMAMLREKGKTEVAGFRLNDTVGERFRLISISGKEVVLEDRSLGFKHRLPFSDGKPGGNTGGGGFGSGILNAPSGRGGVGNQLPYQYQPYNPNGANTATPPGEFIAPGIPQNPNVRPNNNSNAPTRQNAPPKKDFEDDNDDGDNR